MSKFIIILILGFISATLAANGGGGGGGSESDAVTNEFSSVINEDGTYAYKYSTSNGISAQESGLGGQSASGSAMHYAPDGTLVQLTYIADENGFQPSGPHLPTPPPIPDYVLRAIEWNNAHPESEEQPQSSQQQQQYSRGPYRSFRY